MEEMKRQKDANSKRLIEMSGLVKSLQDIPVNYNKTAGGNNFVNVQRKIEAIMEEMGEAKKRYDELRDEKYFQNDTIQAQELQIKSMEQQIVLLNERLQKEESEQKEMQKQQEEDQEANTRDLEEQVMLQEMEMMNLRAEIDQLKRESSHSAALGREIKIQEASNAAKYAEIQKMEEKLASMRVEQETQKSKQADLLRKNTEEQSEFVMKPTATIVAEINKLEDDISNLRSAQEKKTALESSENLKILPSTLKPNPANTKSKSQPWNRDLEWQDSLNNRKTELEVVTNNDVTCDQTADSESQNDEESSLSLPSLEVKKRAVKSARKKKKRSTFGTSDRSVSSASECSQSLESIAEENENESDDVEKNKSVDSNNSDTSVTATGESSTTDLSQTSKVSEKPRNLVELMEADDGSVECVSYTRPELKASLSNSSDDKTADSSEGFSSGSSTSDESSHGGSTRDESSNENSSGIYSSESSAQSSSRSILEQIPEEVDGESESSKSEGVENETDDSDSEWDGEKSVESQEATSLKDQQAGSLLLRKQLKESESKYNKVMNDYKQLVAKSQIRAEKLEEENRKLREGQGKALNNMARECEDESKLRWVKQENKMLLKSMEKQNQLLAKQNKDYEMLQNEHSDTLAKLEEKKKRYDQLILDFSNLAGNGKSSHDYNRLKALHDTVAMKLADMSEENERLEKERDEAIDQLENKDVQIRAYDESIAALNKTEYDLKNLEDVHKETVSELQQLRDKNKELTERYVKESTNASYSEKLREDYVKVMTEMDLLVASNKEFEGIDKKLNAAEVKVAMLEEEIKKNREKLLATKKRSNDRAGQLREVIAQYKALKQEYSDKCAKLARLELAVDGLDNDKAMKEMKTMEEDLEKAKKDATEAVAGKEARENDLKIVLLHYEKLQQKYETLKGEINSVDEPTQEEKKEDPGSIDEEVNQKENIQNLEKLLKESKESMSWKDEKIAKTLTELKEAKHELETIGSEKKELEIKLSEMKSNVLLARKEAENAEGRQNNGQDHLRTAIAKHHQLQQVYDSLLKKFGDTSSELQKAKNDIKVKEQEEKHARKRAAAVHGQYKKLQEDHSVVVQRLEKLKLEMTASEEPTELKKQEES